ncbi:hypothetical protein MKW98_028401 [Papaver atlanticum]|uniref:Uncharacterized protein n=1 Tax=Papaver atlanticum TaxID=357466 RepID=A0AAD4SXR8_9MAGN|nr:hypothetical protein MKW98_028401 [Papaver atlanticum]
MQKFGDEIGGNELLLLMEESRDGVWLIRILVQIWISDDSAETREDPPPLVHISYTSIEPLGDRVLVKIKTAEQKTTCGILLPCTAQQTKPRGGEDVVVIGEDWCSSQLFQVCRN